MGNLTTQCYTQQVIKKENVPRRVVQLSAIDSIDENKYQSRLVSIADHDYQNLSSQMKTSPKRSQQNQYTIAEFQSGMSTMTTRQHISSQNTVTSAQMCIFCHQSIDEEIMMYLICQHIYHKQCLKKLVQKKLKQRKSLITCVCDQKIYPAQLTNILDGIERNQLFQNQLNCIMENTQNKEIFCKCSSKFCDYFYIKDKYYNSKNTLCQLCI